MMKEGGPREVAQEEKEEAFYDPRGATHSITNQKEDLGGETQESCPPGEQCSCLKDERPYLLLKRDSEKGGYIEGLG